MILNHAPIRTELTDKDGLLSPSWQKHFTNIHDTVKSIQESPFPVKVLTSEPTAKDGEAVVYILASDLSEIKIKYHDGTIKTIKTITTT
jgi:hypothetical protein